MNFCEMTGVIKVQTLMISYPGKAETHPHAPLSVDADPGLKDSSTR